MVLLSAVMVTYVDPAVKARSKLVLLAPVSPVVHVKLVVIALVLLVVLLELVELVTPLPSKLASLALVEVRVRRWVSPALVVASSILKLLSLPGALMAERVVVPVAP